MYLGTSYNWCTSSLQFTDLMYTDRHTSGYIPLLTITVYSMFTESGSARVL